MSRTLKRPMFRKGGEVMEGVMTGIKPRESFEDKGMSNAMRDQLANVQQRVNLIDAVAGAGSSPLSNPLTQFLLQTGQNLIGGTAAGGTKLQELVGATRDPLNKAVAAQQRRDASRRKLAATLLAKGGADDISKIKRNAKRIAKETGRDENTVFNNLLNKFMFQDEKSPQTILQQDKSAFKKALVSKKDVYGKSELEPTEADAITDAIFKARKNDNLSNRIDNSVPYIPKKELGKLTATTIKTKSGDKKAFTPSGGVDFQDGFIYYDVRGQGKFLLFNEEQNVLIPLGSK